MTTATATCASPATACASTSGRHSKPRFRRPRLRSPPPRNGRSRRLPAQAEWAALDVLSVSRGDGLRIAAWRELSASRRSLSLRGWLTTRTRHAAARQPPGDAAAGRTAAGTQRCTVAGDGWQTVSAPRLAAPCTGGRIAGRRGATRIRLNLRRAGAYEMPGWGGRLVVVRVKEEGVPLAWLGRIELRARAGAERFQAGIGRPPRSLKKQFQAAGVPAWARDGPLVYSGGQLVYVPGLGLDARSSACPARRWCDSNGSLLRMQKVAGRPAKMRGSPRRRSPRPTLLQSFPWHSSFTSTAAPSMGSTERIRSVAKRVAKWVRAGHQLIVVPSAMSGETNRLLGLAKELSPDASTPALMRELDMIASTGEQVSVGLLSIALQTEGLQAVSYAGLAGADRDRRCLHQGAHPAHRRRARAQRSRCGQSRRHHRLPGRGPGRPHHDLGAADRTPRPSPSQPR